MRELVVQRLSRLDRAEVDVAPAVYHRDRGRLQAEADPQLRRMSEVQRRASGGHSRRARVYQTGSVE